MRSKLPPTTDGAERKSEPNHKTKILEKDPQTEVIVNTSSNVSSLACVDLRANASSPELTGNTAARCYVRTLEIREQISSLHTLSRWSRICFKFIQPYKTTPQIADSTLPHMTAHQTCEGGRALERSAPLCPIKLTVLELMEESAVWAYCVCQPVCLCCFVIYDNGSD